MTENAKAKKKFKARGGFVIVGEDAKGQFKLAVPDGARMTFGPDVPFNQKRGGYEMPSRAYSLRIYLGDELIACLNGVVCFRKESIDMERLIAVETGSRVWRSDEKGYRVEEHVKRDFKSLTEGGSK